ncbi:RagB/SusD family nutrient uptake outer membrane protein [Aquimarina sp. ERC-38]|uniref:RagB/SusD family nutrient uptake outer membrane protein n=1 Tax=Aquimarina sp. ERC-38 TaxID=2949996 RepID=UPI002246A49C|nr:RagB/SusD family nutrient uptake outer membrane protein [Aquimarina sp. ERC-38]UZO81439.1 RagB/SusD family nutrient uptake outer membrane protein [Aquimarina sp. ERC-38]
MKKLINIKTKVTMTAVVLVALVLGCSDELLEQNNNNGTSSDNFGTSPEQVEAAVNGAFHPLTTAFFWGRIIHTGAFLRSDEYNVFEFASNTAMAGLNANPGDRWALEPWQQLYKSIGRCNTIINRVTAEGIPDETVRNQLVGQAYFLRAFDYWYLLNLYGNIPKITEEPNLDDLAVSQADPKEIWELILDDLTKAEEMLPESWTSENLGRPTSLAATALKGKSYLYREEWEEAEQAFREVINSGNYALLPGTQFDNNFSQENENNIESVFELQFLGQQTFVWGTDIPGTGTMGNYHIDYAPPAKTPDRGHVINPWLRDLYEANNDELRRNATLVYDYPGATGYGGLSYQEDFVTPRMDADGNPMETDVQIATQANVAPIFSKKYTGMDIGLREEVDFLGTNVGNNWRIIRYADVLLMMAEALNEQNKTGDAEMFINMVRERANLTPLSGLSQLDMMQAIIDERAMELAGEGHRFLDLVRWELADDYLGPNSLHGTGSNHPKSLVGGTFVSGRDELIWIPIGEISSNPSLEQNPGYQ